MATKRINIGEDIYQIKVTLLGTKPPIWRRLLVPADLTLAQLHDVLQIAMGWQNGHMHEFRIGQRYFGKPDPEYRSMGMDPVENERTVRLPDVLRKTGPKLIYTYDLGDSWEHAIVLEKQLPIDPTQNIPSAGMVNSPVRLKTVGASQDFTISLRPSRTPTTNSTKN